MSRSLGAVLGTLGTAALVATGVGAAAGLALFGTTSVGIAGTSIGLGTLLTASTILAAAGALIGGAAPAQRPDTTASTIRTPLAARVDAFGTVRLPAAVVEAE